MGFSRFYKLVFPVYGFVRYFGFRLFGFRYFRKILPMDYFGNLFSVEAVVFPTRHSGETGFEDSFRFEFFHDGDDLVFAESSLFRDGFVFGVEESVFGFSAPLEKILTVCKFRNQD